MVFPKFKYLYLGRKFSRQKVKTQCKGCRITTGTFEEFGSTALTVTALISVVWKKGGNFCIKFHVNGLLQLDELADYSFELDQIHSCR